MFIFPKYSLVDVANYKSLFVNGDDGTNVLNEATAILINYMPLIGVPELTESNVEDAWLRIATHQACIGTPIDGTNGQRLYLTRNDVRRHIGLRTEGTSKSIELFWQYLIQRGPEGELDCPFVRANNGQSLLSIFGVGDSAFPEADA